MIKCFEEFIKDEEVGVFLSFTKYLGDNSGLARRAMNLFDEMYADYFEKEITSDDADSPEFYENLIFDLQNDVQDNERLCNSYYMLVDYFKNANNRDHIGVSEQDMGKLLNIYSNEKFGYPMVY